MWIHRIERELNRLQRAVRRRTHPLPLGDLRAVLASFGPPPMECLIVHSSLSACGHVRGGAAALVAAWRAWWGAGTLVVPTHTYCYADATGASTVFDPRETASVIGAVSDYFWRRPGVVRSVHPTHSLAAEGPLAESLCQGHDRCDTPCGPGTPYQRLIERGCSALLFGASLNTYTLFYTAMAEAGVPYLYQPQPCVVRYRDAQGCIQELPMRRQDVSVPRRFAEMADWLEQRGLLVRRRLGLAEVLFIPRAAEVHRQMVEQLRRDPLFLVADTARAAVAARWRST